MKKHKDIKILIPHLDYFVYVKTAKIKQPGVPEWAEAWARADETESECTLYLDTSKKIPVELLAHEIMHICQFIARRRNIVMNEELENMGYIMQYLMHRICQEYPICAPKVRIK